MTRSKHAAFLVILSLLLLNVNAWALDPVREVLKQHDAPVKIVVYKAYFSDGSYTPVGIYHSVEYKNVTKRTIEAVEIGMLSFDVWNGLLSNVDGVKIGKLDPGATREGKQVANVPADANFLTGIVYVSRVRFANGDIWEADILDVEKQVKEIDEGLDTSELLGAGGMEKDSFE